MPSWLVSYSYGPFTIAHAASPTSTNQVLISNRSNNPSPK